jgi:hypothetical protein
MSISDLADKSSVDDQAELQKSGALYIRRAKLSVVSMVCFFASTIITFNAYKLPIGASDTTKFIGSIFTPVSFLFWVGYILAACKIADLKFIRLKSMRYCLAMIFVLIGFALIWFFVGMAFNNSDNAGIASSALAVLVALSFILFLIVLFVSNYSATYLLSLTISISVLQVVLLAIVGIILILLYFMLNSSSSKKANEN